MVNKVERRPPEVVYFHYPGVRPKYYPKTERNIKCIPVCLDIVGILPEFNRYLKNPRHVGLLAYLLFGLIVGLIEEIRLCVVLRMESESDLGEAVERMTVWDLSRVKGEASIDVLRVLFV